MQQYQKQLQLELGGILDCAACKQQLKDPITLSCGYTICLACFPSSKEKHRSFLCTARDCQQKKHMFGPTVSKDSTVLNILGQKSNALICVICIRLLKDPITCHCGHTFCKLCLLLNLLMNDMCRICLKRLPSYGYIQSQPINIFIASVGQAAAAAAAAQLSSTLNHTETPHITHITDITNKSYTHIPIYLTEFPILPTQRIHIPIDALLTKYAFICSDDICFAMLTKDKLSHQAPYGTLVKIETIERDQAHIRILGLHRFKAHLFHHDSVVNADIDILQENPFKDECEWTLVKKIMGFISGLAQSERSTSFGGTMEGLLGPVWLQSAQACHGTLPIDDPVALCWWASIALPVANSDRYRLLETESLNERLRLVVSWIRDLESKSV